MSILEGMFSGLVIGLVLSIPAFISETIHHGKNLPILVDVKTFWGARLSPDAVLWWSVGVHLILSTLFGGVYALIVGFIPGIPWSASSLGIYAIGYFLVTGGILLPLAGMGLFCRREGKFVWLELLFSSALYALFLGLIANLFFLR